MVSNVPNSNFKILLDTIINIFCALLFNSVNITFVLRSIHFSSGAGW